MNWLQANAIELISDGLKVLGLIAAAGTVVWQMRKQHRNSLAQQRENAREAPKLRIYETLLANSHAFRRKHRGCDVCVSGFFPPSRASSGSRLQVANHRP